MRWLLCAGMVLACVAGLRAGEENSYVGAKKCMPCHIKEYKSWNETKMSKAFQTIANEADKEKCYKCHTTGYGKPGGFKDPDSTPNLQNVQCESCHGPGAAHMAVKTEDKEGKKKSIVLKPNTCNDCHNPHVRDTTKAAKEAK